MTEGRKRYGLAMERSLLRLRVLPYMLWIAVGAAVVTYYPPISQNDLWIHQKAGKSIADTSAGHLTTP